jgi:iron complex outermembrane recepter protein
MFRQNLLAAAIAAVIIPGVAHAADLEEVVVTAQKRSQSINEVGMSISAASGDELQSLGIADVEGLVKVTPGLTFTLSQNGTPLFTLRGVGFNDYTLGASPAVSVYVDEVPLAYSAFTRGATLDLERVEVLKGPQGLLFGQNSTGGAINYIAAKPSQEFEAGLWGSYGRYNEFEGEGFVSGGLTETLSGRLAVGTIQSDEWQESDLNGDELGAQDMFRGRAQLLWEASDKVTLLFGANGWTDNSDTQGGQFREVALQVADPDDAPLADDAETQRRIDVFNSLSPTKEDAESADWNPELKMDRDNSFYQFTMRADVLLSDRMTLTSITSYSEYDEDYTMDRDGTHLINAGIHTKGHVDSFNQELRLAGDADSLQWLFGLNYASNDVNSDDTISTDDSTNTAVLPGGPWIGAGTTTVTQDIKDYGVFANFEYRFMDSMTALAGARYSKSENDYTACMVGLDPGMLATFPFFSDVLSGKIPGTTVAGPDTCLSMEVPTFDLGDGYEDNLDEDNVSWRVGLNYTPNDDLLLYGLVSKGYKTGSFPSLPAASTAQFAPVGQESVLAYETGFKWSVPEQAIQFNGAVFYYEYDDKQVRGVVKDPIFNQLDRLVNIPKSTISGAELELVWSPIDGLLARVSGTYVDSEVDEWYSFNNALTGMTEPGINGAREQGDFSGSSLPFTPEKQAVADVEYRWPITASLEAFVGGNMLYNSESNSTFGDPKVTRIDAFTTLDLRAGVGSQDGKWTASVWGRNVTDEYYWTTQFLTQDVVVRYAAKPITYGATFRYNFN